MPGPADRPRWVDDFPIRWDQDNYMTRRELAKFLTLGSGLLAGVNVILAAVGVSRQPPPAPAARIAGVDDVAPGGSLLFRYPTAEDPCILLRDASGAFAAFSQVCTHLSCAVVHHAGADALECPCHKGSFSSRDGRPLGGPPTRRLPRVLVERRGGDLVATGIEV
ncbi:MAG TPA: Rieske 2Fe-2S domain-containing protein [Vicinamibacterales bacterium]|nr:Rieske 2Fe-2S domain-containing protein [Vicinamibacterales bacterium]